MQFDEPSPSAGGRPLDLPRRGEQSLRRAAGRCSCSGDLGADAVPWASQMARVRAVGGECMSGGVVVEPLLVRPNLIVSMTGMADMMASSSIPELLGHDRVVLRISSTCTWNSASPPGGRPPCRSSPGHDTAPPGDVCRPPRLPVPPHQHHNEAALPVITPAPMQSLATLSMSPRACRGRPMTSIACGGEHTTRHRARPCACQHAISTPCAHAQAIAVPATEM